MSHIENALYSPYGAFELKATYWRNLLWSNLAVIILVIAALVAAWIFAQNQPVVVVEPDPPPVSPPIDIDLINPPTIIWDEIPGTRPVAPVVTGGIPVPMPDSAIADPDAVIMSQADRADMIGWGTDEPGEPGAFAVNPNLVEALPLINSFVIVEIEAELIKKVSPEYPRLAEKAGLEGTVWIKALVSRTGTVVEAVVYKSSDIEPLDAAALKVAGQYLYKPAIQSNEPVAVWVTYRVDFVLED